MSFEKYYEQCSQNINKAVEIECQGGIVHRGIIESVDHEKVYLRTFEQWDRPADPPGPGVFAYGFVPGAFFGGFTGGLLGVGLGSIIATRPYGPYGGYLMARVLMAPALMVPARVWRPLLLILFLLSAKEFELLSEESLSSFFFFILFFDSRPSVVWRFKYLEKGPLESIPFNLFCSFHDHEKRRLLLALRGTSGSGLQASFTASA
ncbi:hypothetical protein QS257_11830 [Terrilactibacillus sp. S3-3]|nr:hypothetical protein QS257_11830 [Terrilactibacillus sp. S3-3]